MEFSNYLWKIAPFGMGCRQELVAFIKARAKNSYGIKTFSHALLTA